MFKKVKEFMKKALDYLEDMKWTLARIDCGIKVILDHIDKKEKLRIEKKKMHYYETYEYNQATEFLNGMLELLNKPVSIIEVGDSDVTVVASGVCIDYGIATNCKLTDNGLSSRTSRFIRLTNVSAEKTTPYLLKENQCIRDDS
jgi:hypothetical protein